MTRGLLFPPFPFSVANAAARWGWSDLLIKFDLILVGKILRVHLFEDEDLTDVYAVMNFLRFEFEDVPSTVDYLLSDASDAPVETYLQYVGGRDSHHPRKS